MTAQEKRRVDLVVGIGYSSDIKRPRNRSVRFTRSIRWYWQRVASPFTWTNWLTVLS